MYVKFLDFDHRAVVVCENALVIRKHTLKYTGHSASHLPTLRGFRDNMHLCACVCVYIRMYVWLCEWRELERETDDGTANRQSVNE